MNWFKQLKFWNILIVAWSCALIEFATRWLSVPVQDAVHSWEVHFRGMFGARYVWPPLGFVHSLSKYVFVALAIALVLRALFGSKSE